MKTVAHLLARAEHRTASLQARQVRTCYSSAVPPHLRTADFWVLSWLLNIEHGVPRRIGLMVDQNRYERSSKYVRTIDALSPWGPQSYSSVRVASEALNGYLCRVNELLGRYMASMKVIKHQVLVSSWWIWVRLGLS